MVRLRRTPEHVMVIGSGYVGLTTAACLAHLGHRVHCTDVLRDRVDALNDGVVPILERGLAELVREGLSTGGLTFGNDNREKIGDADFVFLCVPTPQGKGGQADLSTVQCVTEEIARFLKPGAIVVNKSTVPVGTSQVVSAALGRDDVAVVSNPEFLREGAAVFDFLHPDRVVVGAEDDGAATKVGSLYSRLGARILYTSSASAELIKYASNAFLATKVTFINAMSELCEATGADAREIAVGMGLDTRHRQSILGARPWVGRLLFSQRHCRPDSHGW